MPNEPTDLSQGVEEDLPFLGLAAFVNPHRPRVEAAVKEARSAGIQVIMLTGDAHGEKAGEDTSFLMRLV